MKTNTQAQKLNCRINLVPKDYLICATLSVVQKIVIIVAAVALLGMTAYGVYGYVQNGKLDKQIAADKAVIVEGHLDELNSLKEQYDNLLLGIDSGNISLIPVLKTQMTELLSVIDKHKPASTRLTGIDGQLKSSGEYTYRLEYSSADRASISGFLEALQGEALEYINISTITKSSESEVQAWIFSVTVKIGGVSR